MAPLIAREAGLASYSNQRVYILAEIGKIITVAELEKRVMELEDRAGTGGRLALPDHSTFN